MPFIRRDYLQLIPRWTFFAPNPGINDYHLVVRAVPKASDYGPWCECTVAADRTRLSFFWNPQKRGKKVLNDAVQSLRQAAKLEEIGEDGLPFTIPYLLLLHAANSTLSPSSAAAIQFAIIESQGHSDRELEAAFISHIHPRGSAQR